MNDNDTNIYNKDLKELFDLENLGVVVIFALTDVVCVVMFVLGVVMTLVL